MTDDQQDRHQNRADQGRDAALFEVRKGHDVAHESMNNPADADR
ncbi:MAG TPA: hypothetical protein VNU03_11940 [Methylomirabilota bacterium]|nr:hypothetical protein [Methylomirabilota bacterium]